MTDYIDFFSEFVMGSVEMLFLFYFFVKLLRKKVRSYFYLLFAVFAAVCYHFVRVDTIAGFALVVLLLIAGGILLCHAEFKSSLLYAALVVEIMQLCYGIVKSLLSVLYPLMSVAFQDMAGMVFMLSGELISLLLSGFCYYMVYRHFSCYINTEIQYMYLVFIPFLMIFIMDEYINSVIYGWEIIEDDGTTQYLINHWQLLIIQLLGISSLFCILYAYKKLLQNFRLNMELSLLEQEERSLSRYVEEAKTHYEKTKSFRHDIRNHIAVVRELLQNGKTQQALHYIEDMEDIAKELSFPCSTNNPVVDVLVGNKLGIATNMGIDVDCSLLLPYPCGLRDIDICIILSNALDNAIHACKNMSSGAEKYIHVSGRIQGEFLMMEIGNSFQGKEMFKKGTGLSNIKTAVEKYHGAMSIKTHGTEVVLNVLLIIPQRLENRN
ncbi:MAG: GHKL domain-containing protein [Lachnospiraceae bacterium]|nr:GHKL domain-containing protein [Lachnospiraceae bacterium]